MTMPSRTRRDYLVSTEWLAERLDRANLRVFDSTVHLKGRRDGKPGMEIVSGRADYEAGHVPGASFLDLVGDLADPSSPLDFTRPSRDRLEAVFSSAGVASDCHVVVYATGGAIWATRLWWLLHSAGHTRASVLDGGFSKWQAEGRPVSTEPSPHGPAAFHARPDEQRWASKDEVLASIGNGSVCTLNALPRSVHTGDRPMGYARPGRIRGSENVPFPALLDPDTGELLPDPELRQHFEAMLSKERVINYCGGGIAATLTAFALTVLGHPNVAVYDGSLSEWSLDESLPMDTGEPDSA